MANMRYLVAVVLLVGTALAKPKWIWMKDQVDRHDAHRQALSHMDEARMGELAEMHDDDFVNAFENDLDLAHVKYARRTMENDAGRKGKRGKQKKKGKMKRKKKGEKVEPATETRVESEKQTCEGVGWTPFGGQCYQVRPAEMGKQSYMQADEFCSIDGGHLLIPTGAKGEDRFLIELSKGLKDGPVWLGLIDETDIEGEWKWLNGEKLDMDHARWAKGSPTQNKMKQCSIVTPYGWKDVNCEDEYQTICQKDTKEEEKLHPFKYCPSGWEYSTVSDNQLVGTCFWVGNDEKNFEEAQKDCESKGANLISVTTQEEYDMTARITRWPFVWIGLHEKDGHWHWTDNKEWLVDGFDGEHNSFLKEKEERDSKQKPLGERKYKAPPVKITFGTEPWCKLEENKDYCDKRNSRWVVGNRWDDWQMWCKRNVDKCNKNKEEEISTFGKCVVINTEKKMWQLRDCNARSSVNYACKKDADVPLPPTDPTRNIPNHFTQFSDKIGDCTTTDRHLIVAHQVCLKNWFELHGAGATVAKLSTQCPNFCDPITSTKGDGSCVWDIACVRCEQLVSLCNQTHATATCERYIAKNIKKSDHNRCPQFDLCYPKGGVMKQIQDKCLDVYGRWEEELKEGGKNETTITYPCDSICAKMDEDCAWKILCKKCTLLMSLSHTGRRDMFVAQLDYIMTHHTNEERCQQYRGSIMPPWWVTGNWI